MGVKKLYTESYIADIADALRTVIGGTDTYNTQEMAATLATIHRGAKDVWIGSQDVYASLGTYDVEICYIIYEGRSIRRVYAGTIILWEETVDWDVEVYNRQFTGEASDVYSTGLYIRDNANYPNPWEFIFTFRDFDGPENDRRDLFACGTNQFSLRHSDGHFYTVFGEAGGYVDGINSFRFTRDENNIFRYYNNTTGELLGTANPGYSNTQLLFGGNGTNYRNNSAFIMEEFKFRWITT